MANLRRQQKKIAGAELDKIMSGNDPQADSDKREAQTAFTQQAGQLLQAQQRQLNRDAMGRAGGTGEALGEAQQAHQALGAAGMEAATRSAAMADEMAKAQQERRKAQALAFSTTVREQNRADRKQAVDSAIAVTTTASQLGQDVGLAAMGL